MGKKYTKGRCAYCGAPASSADHIFAREFFLPGQRSDLPKIPACKKCNSAKSQLEHYLTAILPFGSEHRDGKETLTSLVPARLARNKKLHQHLAVGRSKLWRPYHGLLIQSSALPFDGAKLEALFAYISKALHRYHWKIQIEPETQVDVLSLTSAGENAFNKFFSLNAFKRVRINLANGAFLYEGALGFGNTQISLWRFQVYGGTVFNSGPPHNENISTIGVMIGPKEVADRAQLRARWLNGNGGIE